MNNDYPDKNDKKVLDIVITIAHVILPQPKEDESCDPEWMIWLREMQRTAKEALISAEEKLEKYRRAIGPFVGVCRDVVSICDKQEGGAS